ncbi:hypothetical protein ERJ75_000825400 [Trypanosoma vivax]|nr:hypothetical protein TRVL_07741 [Trypanosoma vivax]KAH8613004.1 hypothetical protein ERJ75_000825900 [Trypanosoma vivax]KAH8613037.1 hypothetical protein ERJ75_000825400 [Trypanosoma vivax]
MPRTHRSALLDHVGPAPKHTKLERMGESLLAQFGTGTSKHFGWLHRVLARRTDRFECRWCSMQDAAEAHPLVESAVDSASAPDYLPVVQCALRAAAGRRCAPSKDSWSGEGLCVGTDQES